MLKIKGIKITALKRLKIARIEGFADFGVLVKCAFQAWIFLCEFHSEFAKKIHAIL